MDDLIDVELAKAKVRDMTYWGRGGGGYSPTLIIVIFTVNKVSIITTLLPMYFDY